MSKRAAIYARYSSDNQSEASIADQIRDCNAFITRNGWTPVQVYTDAAISGASTHLRPGYQALVSDAGTGAFDVIVAEALDRLTRDQEDVARLFKQTRHVGVEIVTISENLISEIHIGLNGTMNALYLRDLAAKTRRGLHGRIEQGQSAGGLSYGYDLVPTLDARGEAVRGARAVNEAEAAVVRRVFEMFAAGESPIAIAKQLNAQGVPGPGGRAWSDTTIRGHAKRGTGLLRNELYIGQLVWNRMRYVKDPATGKRLSRMNKPSEWVRKAVPELRIVDDGLWQQVQDRLDLQSAKVSGNEAKPTGFWTQRRAPSLLSGKVVCGTCGGAIVNHGRDYLACTANRKQGTCDNGRTIRRPVLEGLVLDVLRTQLMAPEHVANFVAEFTQEWNKLQNERVASRHGEERELQIVNRKLVKMVDAVADGMRGASIQRQIDELEARKAPLEAELQLTATAARPPALHPNLALVYRDRVAALQQNLAKGAGAEVIEQTRGLIDRIVLHPATGRAGFEIEILGELAAMLRLSQGTDRAIGRADRVLFERSMKVVAGTGFEPVTFRL